MAAATEAVSSGFLVDAEHTRPESTLTPPASEVPMSATPDSSEAG